jgi:hypothetical protein
LTPARRSVEAIRQQRAGEHWRTRQARLRRELPGGREALLTLFATRVAAPQAREGRLLIWMNGPDFFIAESGEAADAIFNAPLDPDDGDRLSRREDWILVEDDPLVLHANGVPVCCSQREWFSLMGEGFLVVDGDLAPRDP